MTTRLPVFYDPRQTADSGAFSPSAAKPAQLIAHWRETGLPIDVHSFTPLTVEQLCGAHARSYVTGVLDGHLPNGFGNRRSDVCLSLPYTTGSLLAAARFAIAHPKAPAPCSPTSGFHHAGYDFGGGYCTFSGLVIAAVDLLKLGLAENVGLYDADEHFGNGTCDAIEHLPRALRSRIHHITVGQHFKHESQAADFLTRYEPACIEWFAANKCDVVIYQAGQDPHVDDPLGGWLTTEQLAERDRILFEGLRKAGIPACFNLAGGYRVEKDGSIPKVLYGHTLTALAAIKAAETIPWPR